MWVEAVENMKFDGLTSYTILEGTLQKSKVESENRFLFYYI